MRNIAGISGAVSFEFATKPKHYIRHAGHKAFLHAYSNNILYRKDASYREIRENGGIRFQSVNYPRYSLAAQGNGRIAIVRYGGDKRRFLWRIVRGKLLLLYTCMSLFSDF